MNSLKPSINWMFIFIPITLVLDNAGGIPAPYNFFSAALAIVPIARLIVAATEQIATRTGDAIGGLLNATFGNAPELIIAVVALKADGSDRHSPMLSTGKRSFNTFFMDMERSSAGPSRATSGITIQI